jgi:hypothetical protein
VDDQFPGVDRRAVIIQVTWGWSSDLVALEGELRPVSTGDEGPNGVTTAAKRHGIGEMRVGGYEGTERVSIPHDDSSAVRHERVEAFP